MRLGLPPFADRDLNIPRHRQALQVPWLDGVMDERPPELKGGRSPLWTKYPITPPPDPLASRSKARDRQLPGGRARQVNQGSRAARQADSTHSAERIQLRPPRSTVP